MKNLLTIILALFIVSCTLTSKLQTVTKHYTPLSQQYIGTFNVDCGWMEATFLENSYYEYRNDDSTIDNSCQLDYNKLCGFSSGAYYDNHDKTFMVGDRVVAGTDEIELCFYYHGIKVLKPEKYFKINSTTHHTFKSIKCKIGETITHRWNIERIRR